MYKQKMWSREVGLSRLELPVVTFRLFFLILTTVKIWFADFTDGQVLSFWAIELRKELTCTQTHACNLNYEISCFFLLETKALPSTYPLSLLLWEIKSVAERQGGRIWWIITNYTPTKCTTFFHFFILQPLHTFQPLQGDLQGARSLHGTVKII